MEEKKEKEELKTTAWPQALRRKDRRKTCFPLRTEFDTLDSKWWQVKFASSLLGLPLLPGQQPLGCRRRGQTPPSYGEEEKEETFMSLTLQEPLVWYLPCFLCVCVSRKWPQMSNWIQQFPRCFCLRVAVGHWCSSYGCFPQEDTKPVYACPPLLLAPEVPHCPGMETEAQHWSEEDDFRE